MPNNTLESQMPTKSLPRDPIQRAAELFAKEAFEENFASRHGLFEVDDMVLVYDNNPYNDFTDGRSGLRDRKHAALCEKVAEMEGKMIARATYPTEGASRGYTIVMLFSGPSIDDIRTALSACLTGPDTVSPRG